MVWDPVRARVVLFGGEMRGFTPAQYQDTWEWDGSNWLQRAPANSPPAGLWQLVYDAGQGRVLAFDPSTLGAPWAWDGTNWTRLAPGMARPIAGDLVYDSGRQRLVLHGGSAGAPETWEWDGLAWTRVATAGPGRGVVVCDPARAVTLLVHVASTGVQTWEWDGVTWTQRFPATVPFPAPSSGPHSIDGLVFDAARNRVVGHATLGDAGGSWIGSETWEWDGGDWRMLNAGGPVAAGTALAYDTARRHVLSFGGKTSWWLGLYTGQTSTMTSSSPASFTPYGTGCPGSAGPLTLATGPYSLPWTGDAFAVVVGNLPVGSLPWMLVGFSQTANVPLPGCTQLSSGELAVALALSGGTATLSVPIPGNAALAGLAVYYQGAAVNAGGANVYGLAASGGAQVIIGTR